MRATRGSSFTTLTSGCVPSSSNGFAGEPSGITRPPGPQAARRITTLQSRGESVRDGRRGQGVVEGEPVTTKLFVTKPSQTVVAFTSRP